MKAVYWALPLATLGTCGGVFFLMLHLIAQGGGALPFDLRPMGYGLMAARIYLQHLSPAGIALYQGAFRLTDTLFAIFLALTLCLPLSGRGQVWFLPALAYGLCDLAENLAVARILPAGPEVEAQAVALASGFTEGKFVMAIVASALALFAALQLWRNR
jgi:hypothetical protein